MKSGFTLYDKHENKLEITMDGVQTVTIEICDPGDIEHTQAIIIPLDDFIELLRVVSSGVGIRGIDG